MTTEHLDDRHRSFARLYPHAPGVQRLELPPPSHGIIDARRWSRISIALLVAGVVVLFELWLTAPATNLFAFGPTPPWIGIGLVALGVTALAWTSLRLRPRGASHDTTWAAWAAERGLGLVAPSSRDRSAALEVTPSRRYTPTYRGLLGEHEIPVTVCNGFIRGPWGWLRNRWLGSVTAVVELPAGSATRFPASTVDRFARGRRPWRGRSTARLRELHLESADFEDACDVRVDVGPDAVDWWDLMDPWLLDALATRWSVSWQQVGTRLVVYAPAAPVTLDARQLDAVCEAAAAIGAHFIDEGRRTEPSADALRRMQDERRRTHARRHRLRSIVSWVLVAAVLLIPAAVFSSVNHIADRAYAREVLATTTASEVARTIDRCTTSSDPAPDRSRCRAFDRDARARLLELDLPNITEASLRRTTVKDLDERRVLVTSRSSSGTVFQLTLDLEDSGAHRDHSCRPRNLECDDGTWGVDGG